MAHEKFKFASKKDLIIIGILLLISFVWLGIRNLTSDPKTGVRAEIYYNSSLVKTVDLDYGIDEKFAVPGQPEVILQVNKGKIRFYSSTCRDKICIHAGYLSRPGESAACLPRKVAVKLVGTGNSRKDMPDTYIS